MQHWQSGPTLQYWQIGPPLQHWSRYCQRTNLIQQEQVGPRTETSHPSPLSVSTASMDPGNRQHCGPHTPSDIAQLGRQCRARQRGGATPHRMHVTIARGFSYHNFPIASSQLTPHAYWPPPPLDTLTSRRAAPLKTHHGGGRWQRAYPPRPAAGLNPHLTDRAATAMRAAPGRPDCSGRVGRDGPVPCHPDAPRRTMWPRRMETGGTARRLDGGRVEGERMVGGRWVEGGWMVGGRWVDSGWNNGLV